MGKRKIAFLLTLCFLLFAACEKKDGDIQTGGDMNGAQNKGHQLFTEYLEALKGEGVAEQERIGNYQIQSEKVTLVVGEGDVDSYQYEGLAQLDAQESLLALYTLQVKQGAYEAVNVEYKRGVSQETQEGDASEETTAQESTEPTPTVKITIPEGYTLAQIFGKLEEEGVATAQSLFEASQNYDFSYYELVGQIPENEHRCFRLEGYLFPDTYEFYRNSKAEDAIGVFLRNTEKKISQEIREQAKAANLTIDEMLILASLIEKEGANPNEMPNISSIIHNRLEKGMKLELDASIVYVEKHIKPYIDGDVNRYNEYYNTYKCSALPSGPICSPGIGAIEAVLNPADTGYYYFVNDENANYYYAETFEEHQKNLEKVGR